MYSLVVRGSSTGTKNFASLYVGVLMAHKIGVKDGRPSVTILWTLAKSHIITRLEHEGLKSLYCSMEIYSIFHMDKVIQNFVIGLY